MGKGTAIPAPSLSALKRAPAGEAGRSKAGPPHGTSPRRTRSILENAMERPEILKREIKALAFDQYGTNPHRMTVSSR